MSGHRPGQPSNTPEYRAWCKMKIRCYNKNYRAYHRYGGRGIRVCDEWLDDYQAFLIYVGRRPSSKHSLDRYPDNNGNYEPGNVRWATQKEQGNNTCTTRVIKFNGKSQTVTQWAEELGLKPATLWARLYAYGWGVAKSLSTPLRVWDEPSFR